MMLHAINIHLVGQSTLRDFISNTDRMNGQSKNKPLLKLVVLSRSALASRVDLHTPKMLIIQFHTSSVWENACHTIFIQFLKMVENWYKLFSVAV